MPTVSILRVRSDEDLYDVINRGLTMINCTDFGPTDTIIIKPNLCDLRSAETGATTSPALVRGVIQFLKEKGVKDIAIVESDHQVATADECFERLGYCELAEETDVRTLNLSREPRVKIGLDGFFFREFNLPEIFLHCSKFISMPKIKTHTTPPLWKQTMTCAMKNQFGLIPERYKSKYHPFLPEVLADLNNWFRPDIVIVDGMVAMEGLGPGEGDPKSLQLVLFGDDPISVDMIVARLMGLSPSAAPFLRFCIKKRLAPSNINILGEKLEEVKAQFDLPTRTLKQRFLHVIGARFARAAYKTSNTLNRLSELSVRASNASTSDMLRYLFRLKRRTS